MQHFLKLSTFILLLIVASSTATPLYGQESTRALGGSGKVEQMTAAFAPGFVGGTLADVRRIQRSLQNRLANSVRAIKEKSSPRPFFVLIALSFAYGIFHAAGPGHGKVVISAYLLAREESLRRGVLLATFAALLQAISAIGLVGGLALVMGATNLTTLERVGTLEATSYGVVALLGLWMLWRSLREAWMHRKHHDGHSHHDHGHGELMRVASASWREAAVVVLAVGIRPCSGAVIVLLFALVQGLLTTGMIAALAMSVGTAITVSVLAAISIALRRGALTLTFKSSRWGGGVASALGIAGAMAVTLFGLIFFAAAL